MHSEDPEIIRPHRILPARCACGSWDVENGYDDDRHGYVQMCNLCGLEMFWSSDMLTYPEVEAMFEAYRREFDLAD